MSQPPLVISLGGSVVVPDQIDVDFLRAFRSLARLLSRRQRVVVVCGGGSVARSYVAQARRLGVTEVNALHRLGVRACQLNAELVRTTLGVRIPLFLGRRRSEIPATRLFVAAPYRIGATSDLASVRLARLLRAPVIVNMTDVDGVYTADPRKVGHPRLFDTLSWSEYRRLFAAVVRPGMHVPFDPAAARRAERLRLRVVVLSGNVGNLRRWALGKAFRGTVLG